MSIRKYLPLSAGLLIIILMVTSCSGDASSKVKSEKATLSGERSHYALGEEIRLKLSADGVDSIWFEGVENARYLPGSEEVELSFGSCGTRLVKTHIWHDGQQSQASMRITIYSPAPAQKLSYQLMETIAHNPNSYTQGLEFYQENLYESRGQYGQSGIDRFEEELLQADKSYDLPADIFGEGLTAFNNKIVQLSWRERKVFFYTPALELLQERAFPLNEGWGICHQQDQLLVSDGSHRLYRFDSLLVMQEIKEVYEGKEALSRLNELEFVEGYVWANVYRSNLIFRINPQTGVADAYLDLSPLRAQLQNPMAEVMNGIAWHPGRQQFLVTGKYWDKAFWIAIDESAPGEAFP